MRKIFMVEAIAVVSVTLEAADEKEAQQLMDTYVQKNVIDEIDNPRQFFRYKVSDIGAGLDEKVIERAIKQTERIRQYELEDKEFEEEN